MLCVDYPLSNKVSGKTWSVSMKGCVYCAGVPYITYSSLQAIIEHFIEIRSWFQLI